MKNKTDYSNDSRFYEQFRQQIGILPGIELFPATRTAEQSAMYSRVYLLQPSMMQVETGNSTGMLTTGDEASLLKTVKGIVRSIVFFNWKDHA